jgi:two-component system nitrogen regulation response regulator GlnG
VESELFGHVRGAFTGAVQPSPGLLALAAGGTLFLDEVGDIPLQVQVKLLRVLEHGEFLPVGAGQAQPLDVRVLAATHQDLNARVAQGSFRHDLFFRLNVFPIHLLPLRERPEDVLPLAEHFLRRWQPQALPLLPETQSFLRAHPWPGNVRELRNALEHAVIVARGGPLLPEHFPALDSLPDRGTPAEDLDRAVRRWLREQLTGADGAPADLHTALLQCVEPALLDEVLRRLQGNRWAAAQWLGLNRATVRKKLHHYGLNKDAERGA